LTGIIGKEKQKEVVMKQAPKKWMVVLSDSQYDWIKETSEKTDVSGAAVCRALISQAMEQNASHLHDMLMSTRYKTELQELEEKQRVMAERAKELKAKLSGKERVAV
jgi:riboflavin synthase alpha subunit